MRYGSKIRMSIGWIYPIGILISYIFLILEVAIRKYLFGNGQDIDRLPYLTIILVSVFFIVLGIIQWFRYRNWINPVLGFLIGITTLQVSFIYGGFNWIFKLSYFASFIIMVLFIIINWQSFYSEARFEINSRRLFRLASERIYDVSEGYTGRPLPSGKAEYTESQLKYFAEFLQRNLVAMAFRETGGIALVPVKMGDEFSFIFNPGKFRHTRTWIFFDFEGNVTVSISKKDYLEYREELTFDELCENLAALFIEFLEYHKKEEGGRIIWKLDDLRLSFTS